MLHEQIPTTTSTRKVSVEEGVISLLACKLLMIKLGPVSDNKKGKYTLQILSDEDGSIIHECDTIRDKLGVKFALTRYDKRI